MEWAGESLKKEWLPEVSNLCQIQQLKKKKRNQGNWIHVAQEEYVLENYCNEADENCEQKH